MNSILRNKQQTIIDIVAKNKAINLELIEQRMYSVLADAKGIMNKMCNHIATSGGKRVRPLLVLNSGLMFSEVSSDLINTAIAVELIHMASLVHDDIIDHSDIRRNKPSVNKLWGNHYGVLCGDYLYARAFNILSTNKTTRCLNIMVEAIENMCDGEIIQDENKFSSNMTFEKYYTQISKKTACLLASCCSCGALIGGANDMQTKTMSEYGKNLGLAYQIIDDILDFCGDKVVMGKPQGEDLRQGIITLPVILLINNKKCSDAVLKILSKDVYSDHDINTINKYLAYYDTIEEAYKIAHLHIERAKTLLDEMPNSPYKHFLLTQADKMKARKH